MKDNGQYQAQFHPALKLVAVGLGGFALFCGELIARREGLSLVELTHGLLTDTSHGTAWGAIANPDEAYSNGNAYALNLRVFGSILCLAAITAGASATGLANDLRRRLTTRRNNFE